MWKQVENVRKEYRKTQVQGRFENLCDSIDTSLIYCYSSRRLFIAKILFSVHFTPPYQRLCLP